jgi:hypothetical protein
MYTVTNFKTKKALRDAVKSGAKVEVYQPGGFFPAARDGRVSLEGPHYPRPHTWYASATIADGAIVKLHA